jgi:hypothetical protein
MRKDDIVVSVLSFFVMAAVIGFNVLASCLLALGIVLAYGLCLKLLMRTVAGERVVVTVTSAILALLSLLAAGGLVFLWSRALAQPYPWSLSLWFAILASGATWALLASWFEQRRQGGPHPLSAVLN